MIELLIGFFGASTSGKFSNSHVSFPLLFLKYSCVTGLCYCFSKNIELVNWNPNIVQYY